jgi:hypothetical protein
MNAMTRSYLETLLWSETLGHTFEYDGTEYDENDNLDQLVSYNDLPKDIVERAERDCADFVEYAGSLGMDLASFDEGEVGHDFALSRNGHGAGFFDSDYVLDGENIANRLQSAAKSFGSFGLTVYVSDARKLAIECHN